MLQYEQVMKRIVTLLVVLLVGLFAAKLWWDNGMRAVDSSNTQTQLFVVKRGKTIREIASLLKQENLITDPIVFFLYVKQQGKDKDIQAGNYRLSRSMTLPQIVDQLTQGRLDTWVVVPEGLRAEEIAEILKKELRTYDSSIWDPVLIEQNGYLFPDSYLIPLDADITLVVNTMRDNFNKKIKELGELDERQLQEAVIVASLIEREARNNDEKPLIASVIYNRIKLGMPLQIDATVQYALGYDEKEKRWWKRHLTLNDLKRASDYNTYENVRLPPRPISNPGLDSLRAALNPARSDYLYYLHDSSGKGHFAKTLAEHNRNIDTYLR